VGPWTGYSFFPTERAHGPLVFIPSVSITEEYNDNIFLDNARRESDFITQITPAIRVVSEGGNYRIGAGYSFTSEKYAKHTEFDAAFRRHNVFAEGFWRATPVLTLTLIDTFVFGNDTNLVSTEGVSSGRRNESWSNTFTPGVIWQASPTDTVRAYVTYIIQRFTGEEARDSDSYSIFGELAHAFTPRLSGTVSSEYFHQTVQGQPDTTSHIPRIGVIYRITPTLTGSVAGGPAITSRDGETDVSPAVTAILDQQFKFGGARFQYDRRVGTAGGLGGTTENQTAALSLVLTRLAKDFTLGFTASYFRSESLGNDPTGVDVQTYQLGVRAAYAFTPWAYGLIGYNFFRQRSDSAPGVLATDVDQNRIFVGVQFAYPIRKD
jgi:hypothetical protein